uniref:Thiamine biosynthesis ATP pyrophosphatase-like protein (ThiI) n=1 Tax=uncultured marine thaumarchaeote KM3_86_D01 TaxID=1456320 RepID=A0A075HUE2_9ARCH|nr:thiamine biosynthesis ATP pyrophosphatase-like protein (thiI) [uncultured marine thaumarchaeote KM3_86_D01]
MKNEVLVVVFPSIFSKNKVSSLIANIKKVLKIQNQKFCEIRKEGDVIIVEADDPVFASSAINTLFGIKGVAIAKQVANDFESIISGISKIGADVFLKGERFLLQIEGHAKGFTTKDIELAATSSLIEKTAEMGIKPGTSKKYDRKLYVYLTKLNAYICIYYDNGLGGIPNNSQNKKIVCCIFDELSAVSCLETIKHGFDVKIIVCYSKDSELLHLVRMVNQIIHRTVKPKINLEFYKIPVNKKLASLLLTEITAKMLVQIATTSSTKRISLSLSPLIHPVDFVESLIKQAYNKNLVPYFPLSGLDDNVFETAKEIGLEKYLSRIKKLGSSRFYNFKQPPKKIEKIVEESITSKKTVLVNVGQNNVHEILDEVRSNN